MLLLFNTSENLECAKVVVLKLGAILFYSGIHFKPLKLWKTNKQTNKQEQKQKQIRVVGTCRKVPLVYNNRLRSTLRIHSIILKKSSFMFQNNDSNHSLGPKKPDFSILMPLSGCIYA